MSKLGLTAFVVALFGYATLSHGGIIGWKAPTDGDGAIVCEDPVLQNPDIENPYYTLKIRGDQYGPVGHIGLETLYGDTNEAYFTVNEDPTVRVRNTIDNDTTFAWTSYNVKLTMSQPFLLSAVTVYTPDTSVSGWGGYVASYGPVGSNYVGVITYSGPAIVPTGTLDFGYKVTFNDSVHYCQELTPVPEPSTLALMAVAGLAGLAFWRRSR